MIAPPPMSKPLVSKKADSVRVRMASQRDMREIRSEIMSKYFSSRQHYDAASRNRLRDDWSTIFDVPYSDIKNDLMYLIARSRREVSNNGIAQGIVKTVVSNVIGTGMWPKPNVKDKNGKLLKKINQAFEYGWNRFVDQFDVTGHSDFYHSQAMMLETEIVSGTILLNRAKAPKNAYLQLAYQMIEPDRLDTGKDNQVITLNQNDPQKQILHGIGIDEYYRPVRYYIKGIENPISSEYMTHHYLRKRPEQLIGVPWLHASLPDLWDYRQLKEDSIVKSRIISDIVMWMNTEGSSWPGANSKKDDGSFAWEPGTIARSKHKPEIIQADDKVGDMLKPLMRMVLLDACSGAGISHMSVARDMEGVNFAAARTNLMEDRRQYKFIQDHEIRLYQKIYTDFCTQMVLENKIPGLNVDTYYSDMWKYTQCHWQSEGWDWVDPSKDANSSETMLKNMLTNWEAELGKRGVDWRDNVDKLAEQIDYAKSKGIDLTKVFAVSKNNENGSSENAEENNDSNK